MNEYHKQKKMINKIYDKLMDNQNPLETGKVKNQIVDLETQAIYFDYGDMLVDIKINIKHRGAK